MIKVFKNKKGQQLLLESYDKLLELWDVSLSEKDIETRYGSTHIIFCGDKSNPPLLLFHGVGDNTAIMWIFNAKELSKSFFLIAVDTIGGPGKSVPNNNYGKGFRQVLWIDDILDSLGLKNVNIAGVSNGAYLAQLYTSKRPNRVNLSICMAGSVAVPTKNKFAMFKTFKVFLPEALFPTDKNIIRLLSKICGVNKDVFLKNNNLILHWKYLLKYGNPMAMGFHKIEPLSAEEIEILSKKTLFIIGNCDPITPVVCTDIFEANSINYLVIEGAGHGINHEFASRINSIICEYFSTNMSET